MAETLTPEQQIQALTQQLTDLQTKSDQKEATIAEQKGQLKTQGKDLADTIKDRDQAAKARDKAQADLATKVERVRELEGEAEANEEVIARYQAQQKRDKIAGEGGATVVTHEAKNYRVLVPQFHFEGKLVKATDLAVDATLVAQLVETKSGVLELVAD